ncbi:MAG: hypothetical protein K2L06_00925 [Alistipes sp.]|nr:hypothetical protein [Alistipes sp.]
MNANPMTEQVNRLIANRLAAGCELFLPGVGSLYVEQRGARRLDDDRVVPPCRAVGFTDREQGVSLVDEIVRAARCDHEKAQSIYDRWLDNVVGERTLTIAGVGQLKGTRFNSDPEFDLMLNPYGSDPVRLREKRSDCALWIALLALVSALAIGYFAFFAERIELPEAVQRVLGMRNGPAETVAEEMPAPEILSVGDAAAMPGTPAAADSIATTAMPEAPGTSGTAEQPAEQLTERPAENAAETAPAAVQGSVGAPAALVSGRSYVVAGVFVQPENAEAEITKIRAVDGTLVCRVYRFRGKLMVSPFESDDPAACQRFMRAHRSQWPDIWTYTAR